MRHVKKGDKVAVIAGKHKGEQGTIIEVLVEKQRVRIEGVNTIKVHIKPGRNQQMPNGGILEKFGTIHWSNVLPVDPESGKPTRVGIKRLDDGRKVRFAKRSGAEL